MPKVLIDGTLVDVPDTALFADDGTTPFAATIPPVTNPATGRMFTEEEVNKIREDEKNKLYSRLDTVTQELQSFKEQVGSLTAAEQRREAQLAEEQARLAEEARVQEEQGLDAQTLVARAREEWNQTLTQKQQEWDERFSQSEQQRQQAEAIAAKEREFNDLRDYITAQVTANEAQIAPQLRTWINGSSREEVDAAIARAIETTNELAADFQQSLEQIPNNQQAFVFDQQAPAPPATPGTRSTAPVGADAAAQFQTLTQEQIQNMPMDQYAKLRGQLNIGNQSQNRGLYG